ncbi:hypothetical protein D1BOALGB6SA_4082 [Olavius sp. associated proteobacterium Delta 1]|nr:hypothetical protein D1BOALGB6SA_4082 [Olavius sp. associated proteobacterium Delta 1]
MNTNRAKSKIFKFKPTGEKSNGKKDLFNSEYFMRTLCDGD